MGDRTWVSITVLKRDRHIVEDHDSFGEANFDASTDMGDGTVELGFEEVNGGGYDGLKELAENGLVFTASHGAGYEYSPCTFASFDGELFEMSMTIEGAYVEEVDLKTGALTEGAKKRVAEYAKALNNVMEYFHLNGEGGN